MNLYSRDESGDLFTEFNNTRSVLDQLLTESKLYTKSKDFKELMDFVVRLRNFAPFNAMLLHIQKRGLSYAASAKDWQDRFGRRPKDAARPLLILRPFGPIALVYDVLDTEGRDLPEDVDSFVARGPISEQVLVFCKILLEKKKIEYYLVDEGDKSAGLIYLMRRGQTEKEYTAYRIHVNRNHSPAVQFNTLAHELGHLFLGHLGPDKMLSVPDRAKMNPAKVEIEAESVAYIVCARNGVKSKSEAYLSHFVEENTTIDQVDIYQIVRAAGQVEAILGLTIDKNNSRRGGRN